MKQAFLRNAAFFLGLFVTGAICVMAAPYFATTRGVAGPSVLLAQSPIAAGVAVVICMALAALVAGVVGRFSNAAVSMFVLGVGLFVLASRLAVVTELVLGSDSGRGMFITLSIEAVLWSLLCFASVLLVYRIAGPLPDVHPEDDRTRRGVIRHLGPTPAIETRALEQSSAWIISRIPIKGQAAKSLFAAVLMLPLVWLIARSPMKGQVIGAVFVAAMIVGLVGRLVAPNTQPVLLYVVPILVGAIGHVIGAMMLAGSLDAAWAAGQLSPLNLPMPIDYAAGTLMGVAVGVGWAKSFLRHDDKVEVAAQPEPRPAS